MNIRERRCLVELNVIAFAVFNVIVVGHTMCFSTFD
jgi:hypothetical protein